MSLIHYLVTPIITWHYLFEEVEDHLLLRVGSLADDPDQLSALVRPSAVTRLAKNMVYKCEPLLIANSK